MQSQSAGKNGRRQSIRLDWSNCCYRSLDIGDWLCLCFQQEIIFFQLGYYGAIRLTDIGAVCLASFS